jgi:hypothetical protein
MSSDKRKKFDVDVTVHKILKAFEETVIEIEETGSEDDDVEENNDNGKTNGKPLLGRNDHDRSPAT